MSTRRLIITALVCGMAILLAGGVFLVRVAGSRAEQTVTFQEVARPVTVGDLTVTVVGYAVTPDEVSVQVEVDATRAAIPLPGAADAPWALVRNGKVRELADRPDGPTGCRNQQIAAGARVACTLVFRPGGAGGNVALFRWRDLKTVSWRLD